MVFSVVTYDLQKADPGSYLKLHPESGPCGM